MQTIAAILADAARRLTAAGVPNPIIDAQWLLAYVCGYTRTDILLQQREAVSPAHAVTFQQLLRRRFQREPLQYILGTQEFYGRTFAVTPAVLIPRPETEQLVETALGAIAIDAAEPLLEIGTGSGCIAITLLAERKQLPMIATDIAADALVVAAENATQHAVQDRLAFQQTADCWPASRQRFAGIISNPPYLAEADARHYQPELAFEPHHALCAGLDGLAVIRRIVRHAAEWLAPGGFLCLEVGAGQAVTVGQLMIRAGLQSVEVSRDLQGIERIVTARYAGA